MKGSVLEFFLGDKSAEKRFELKRHIDSCPECRPLFAAAEEMWAEGAAILKSLEGADWGSLDRRSLSRRAEAELRTLKARRKSARRTFLVGWRIPAAVAMACALLAVIAVLFLRTPQAAVGERSADEWQVLLVTPRGETAPVDLIFEWSALSGARSYFLEIFDRWLNPVYRSASLIRRKFTLPADVSQRLERSVSYFWKVTAVLEGRQTIESEFEKFSLKRN